MGKLSQFTSGNRGFRPIEKADLRSCLWYRHIRIKGWKKKQGQKKGDLKKCPWTKKGRSQKKKRAPQGQKKIKSPLLKNMAKKLRASDHLQGPSYGLSEAMCILLILTVLELIFKNILPWHFWLWKLIFVWFLTMSQNFDNFILWSSGPRTNIKSSPWKKQGLVKKKQGRKKGA